MKEFCGKTVQCKSGHAFIKEKMRSEDAIYGGEMSAHHYFRDFAYCDSGMIPWLLVAGLMSASGKPGWDRIYAPMPTGFAKARLNDIDSVAAAMTPQTVAVMIEFVQGEADVLRGFRIDGFWETGAGLSRDAWHDAGLCGLVRTPCPLLAG